MLLPRPVAPPVTRIFLPASKFFVNTKVLSIPFLNDYRTLSRYSLPDASLCTATRSHHQGSASGERSWSQSYSVHSHDGDVILSRPRLPRKRATLAEDTYEFGVVRFPEIELQQKFFREPRFQ